MEYRSGLHLETIREFSLAYFEEIDRLQRIAIVEIKKAETVMDIGMAEARLHAEIYLIKEKASFLFREIQSKNSQGDGDSG